MFDPLEVSDQSKIIVSIKFCTFGDFSYRLPILMASLAKNLSDCEWNCILQSFLRCQIEIVSVKYSHVVRCYRILLDP